MLSLVENLFLKKNPLKNLLSSANAVISTNEKIEFITGHMTYDLAYTEILQTTATVKRKKSSVKYETFKHFPKLF